MGRTAVHTQDEVFQAADKLAANGQEVTPNALRDLLGRGSYSTFVKHIAAWEQARQAAPAPVVFDMPDNVKAAFAQCWQVAATEAGKEIAAIREKADAEVKASKRRLEDAIAAVSELEAEQEADAVRFDELQAQLAAERVAVQRAATEAAALTAANEQMRQQIEAQQAELLRVHAELTAVSKEARDAVAGLARASGELEALRNQVANQQEVIKGFAKK